MFSSRSAAVCMVMCMIERSSFAAAHTRSRCNSGRTKEIPRSSTRQTVLLRAKILIRKRSTITDMSHIIQRETAGMIFAMGRSSRCCPSAIHNPKFEVSSHRKFHESTSRRHLSSWKDLQLGNADRPAWSDEWKLLGLGAKLVDDV
jgi:hypothetical protein